MVMSLDEELYEIFRGLCPSVQRARAEGREAIPGDPPPPDLHAIACEAFAEFLASPMPCPVPDYVEPEREADPILMVQLEACLEQHDWHTDFSDDVRVYRRGRDEWERIERLVERTGRAGEELRDLWIRKTAIS
jgi:hypothetical protein